MEKRALKLKKETLSNLTNLNTREMEEIKGGGAVKSEAEKNEEVTILITVTLPMTVTLTI